MDDILQGLDALQKGAVLSDSRRLLVVAPPGSGKTRVLASRFALLISEGAAPEGLLAVTFTNRAAREMRERIRPFCPHDGPLNIGTFHGFSLRLLKKEAPGFTLVGRDGQTEILKGLGIKNPHKAAEAISLIKNGSAAPDGGGHNSAYALYQERLKETGGVDFDDLINNAIDILRAGKGPRLDHLLVDEYQDINPRQAELLKLLAKDARSLLAIGDPDQAIYSFRGSSLESFIEFEKDFEGAEVIRLERNYRSAPDIVAASDALIANNPGRIRKATASVRGGGEVHSLTFEDEGSQAGFIIREIERMMGGLSSLTAADGCACARFSDFAVLYRTNRQAEAIAAEFGRSSIPFHVAGPPGPGFSGFIRHLGSKDPGGVELADFIRAEGAALGVQEDIIGLFTAEAQRYGAEGKNSLADFLEEMLLAGSVDLIDIDADKVSLMTLHAAKGLEFKAVFIAGVDDGLVPLRIGGECDTEEERRLFYVGMTRARDRLFLLSSLKRRSWGQMTGSCASPFLKELPEGIVRSRAVEKKKTRRPAQKGLFE